MATIPTTFIDRFNFHLALNLFGRERLEEFGMPTAKKRQQHKQHDQPSSSNSLKWKSKIFDHVLGGNDQKNYNNNNDHNNKEEQQRQRLLFLDITFDLILLPDVDGDDGDKKSSLHFNARFGCFLLKTADNNGGFSQYVRAGKLTLEQLEAHFQGMDIDFHAASPKAMAGMMAGALSTVNNNNNNATATTAKIREGNQHLDLFLCYSSASNDSSVDDNDEESSSRGVGLTLDIEETTSRFDDLGVSLFLVQSSSGDDDANRLCDSKKATADNNGNNNEDMILLEESFEEGWFEKARARLLKQIRFNARKAKITATTATATSNDKEQTTAAGQKPPQRQQPPPLQYQYTTKVSYKRRRKKSKLSFAKQRRSDDDND